MVRRKRSVWRRKAQQHFGCKFVIQVERPSSVPVFIFCIVFYVFVYILSALFSTSQGCKKQQLCDHKRDRLNIETKLRRLRPTNVMVDDSDSKPSELERRNTPHSKFDIKIGFWLNIDTNFRWISTNFWLNLSFFL